MFLSSKFLVLINLPQALKSVVHPMANNRVIDNTVRMKPRHEQKAGHSPQNQRRLRCAEIKGVIDGLIDNVGGGGVCSTGEDRCGGGNELRSGNVNCKAS
jgi:hypothetical protein